MESETEKIYIQSGEIRWCLKVKKEIYNRFMKECKGVPMSKQMALITKISGEVNGIPSKE